ncbi:MAG: hypothetical protein FJ215_11830 [Ignavibacteria bacterium]|nr:hypothetical protein [Ignavibacteria bacterium]
MGLELKIVFLFNAVITALIGFALLLYRTYQKVYPGFIHWSIGTFVAALAHTLVYFRSDIPLWIGVLFANALYLLAGLMRMDGVLRFLRNDALHRLTYGSPILFVALLAFFYFFHDSIIIRIWIFGFGLGIILWATGAVSVLHAPRSNRAIYYVAGLMNGILGLGLMVRALFFTVTPSQSFHDTTLVAVMSGVFVLGHEVGWGLLFFMMNSHRIEGELLAAQGELKASIDTLQRAMSEVKTLQGLLPICSSRKRIRDDHGGWSEVEAYVQRHSEATFTHGICPDCAKRFYPQTR